MWPEHFAHRQNYHDLTWMVEESVDNGTVWLITKGTHRKRQAVLMSWDDFKKLQKKAGMDK